MEKDEGFFVAFFLDVVERSVDEFLEDNGDFVLVHLYFLVVVLVKGVALLRDFLVAIPRLLLAHATPYCWPI